jgi:hypothetical protein
MEFSSPIYVLHDLRLMKSTNYKFLTLRLPLSAAVIWTYTFLSSRPRPTLTYGILISETKCHTPEKKMGEMPSVWDYTNIPLCFTWESKCTNFNKNKMPWQLSKSPVSEINIICPVVLNFKDADRRMDRKISPICVDVGYICKEFKSSPTTIVSLHKL